MKISSRKNIIITTGDSDGIGLEVTVKAILHLKKSIGAFNFFIYHNSSASNPHLLHLKKTIETKSVSAGKTFSEIIKTQGNGDSLPKRNVFLLKDTRNPSYWVEDAVKYCLLNSLNCGLVTGPLSKQTIWEAKTGDIGHTGIIKRLSGIKKVNMGFLGHKFNVVLATDHIPLNSVGKSIQTHALHSALSNCADLVKLLPPRFQKLPIGVLGLNPHSGDGGLIGNQELENIIPSIESFNKLQKSQPVAVGPLVPDAAFLSSNYKKYSMLLAMYHDQGLIPFKSLHGQSGTHITLGIPFIRTSVDHGTAKDIFHKNNANFQSMCDSIRWCMSLLNRRQK